MTAGADPSTAFGMTAGVIPSERSESMDLHLKLAKHSGGVQLRLGTRYVSRTGTAVAVQSNAVASLTTSPGTPPGKYALCTYCRTIRCVLKKLPFSEIAERITSAYANGSP
jgi:hypothetical protein